jgi:Mg2+ transporter MgtE
VADILEQLTPTQRARVFEHLDNAQAALTVAELEDELQADLIDDLGDQRASDILEEMDPDDAADIIGDLPYDKAEALLRLMGVGEARAIRSLLGYKEKTAGGIMTPEVTTVDESMTVQEVIDYLRTGAAEHETIYYIYVVEADRRLEGVISLRDLVMSEPSTPIAELVSRDVMSVGPDDDQEDVAETMSKYDLLALPVVDETGRLLGIVTVDDALEVMEEESAEDLELATGSTSERGPVANTWWWLARRSAWLLVWAIAFVVVIGVRKPIEAMVPGNPFRTPFAVGFDLMVLALILLPLLLRTAEELSSRTLAELIEGEDDDERPSLGRRLLREGAVGLATAVVAGLVALALMLALPGSQSVAAGPFAATTAVATLLTVLLGGILGHRALKRSAAGKRVSGGGLAMTAMFVGSALYLGLAFGAGVLWVSTLLANLG